MYKKFAVLTACVAAPALLLAATAHSAEEVKSGNAEGAITQRSVHCESQAAALGLTGDAKASFVKKCSTEINQAARSTARKVQGSKTE